MKSLNELAKDIRANAITKGFIVEGEPPLNFGERIALIHSELSEALEADRNNRTKLPENIREEIDYRLSKGEDWEVSAMLVMDNYKDHVGFELADAMIRILDYCAEQNLDIEWYIETKMKYNATRPYKHGGKKY